MKSFKDLVFTKLDEPYNGKQAKMQFDNGFGISVVSHNWSYGGPQGMYEIAVLDSDDCITYDTPITNDVIGWLSKRDVSRVMKDIQKLRLLTNHKQ